MEAYTVKVFEIFHVTHDVKGFRLLKPEYYSFDPGQATELAINKPGWREEKRPFTFTNLPEILFVWPASHDRFIT